TATDIRARGAAGTAVLRVRLGVDADAAAERLARGARRACAIDADLAGPARDAAPSAVRGIVGRIHTDAAALRGSPRAIEGAHAARRASLVARAAVRRVELCVLAGSAAVLRSRSTDDRARAADAELSGNADVAAAAAVHRIDVGVDALATAVGAVARERAHAA